MRVQSSNPYKVFMSVGGVFRINIFALLPIACVEFRLGCNRPLNIRPRNLGNRAQASDHGAPLLLDLRTIQP